MSILIKGINVKEIEHGAVAIINIDDTAYFVYGDDIVAIPDHGDLIDRDVLLSKVQKWYWEALETVKRMPTVIPAERSEDVSKPD